MYIENLRKRLISLNESDFKEFTFLAYNYHIDNLSKSSLKRSDFKSQLENFMKNNTRFISFDNFNSYLFALDMLDKRGAQNALFNPNRERQPNSWRELFIKITQDLPLPKGVKSSHFDKNNISILKSIMKRIIIHTSSVEIADTSRRLMLFNEFLKEFLAVDK